MRSSRDEIASRSFRARIVNGLQRVGYQPVRQKGDHQYMTTTRNGEHHVAIPVHRAIKVGTLGAIVGAVSNHTGLSREQLFREMKL